MNVAIGCDHGGLDHKNAIKEWLLKKGHKVEDFGTFTTDGIDYNEIALSVAEGVRDKKFERGILICGTGVGMSIMANKVHGVRAALVHYLFTAEATRLHNDSNVLTMGGRVISIEKALQITEVWINTPFSEQERHARRIEKIDYYKGE